jgi:hypothetical protein
MNDNLIMSTPPEFSSLSWQQDSLLDNSFYSGRLALLSLTLSSPSFAFHTRLSERLELPIRASSWLQYSATSFLLRAKRRNDGHSHFSLDYTPFPSIPLTLSCSCTPFRALGDSQTEAEMHLNYSSARTNSSLSFFSPSSVLRLQTTMARGSWGVGALGNFETNALSVGHHAVAAWWENGKSHIVAKHSANEVGSIGTAELSVLHKVSQEVRVAAQATSNWCCKTVNVMVASEMDYDQNTLVKARIDAGGSLGFAARRTFGPGLTVSAALELKAHSLLTSQPQALHFGLRLDFTH